mmetsp:Transcript_96563/g.282247  ORF Transcript_96563/g.282247 Transcript_96563/m.282247 type:complete len:206 (-) Transcript_96563:623-1240(-)
MADPSFAMILLSKRAFWLSISEAETPARETFSKSARTSLTSGRSAARAAWSSAEANAFAFAVASARLEDGTSRSSAFVNSASSMSTTPGPTEVLLGSSPAMMLPRVSREHVCAFAFTVTSSGTEVGIFSSWAFVTTRISWFSDSVLFSSVFKASRSACISAAHWRISMGTLALEMSATAATRSTKSMSVVPKFASSAVVKACLAV